MDYTIVRTKGKNLRLTLDQRGALVVKAPRGLTKSKIDEILNKNSKLVERTLEKGAYRVAGYCLEREGMILRFGDKVKLESTSINSIKKFYKEGRGYLEKRIYELSKVLDLPFRNLKFGSAKTLWGTCSKNGDIRLNERLYSLPPRLIDYVIIHELVHTVEFNHSKRFWGYFEKVYPNAKKYRKELNEKYSWVFQIYR